MKFLVMSDNHGHWSTVNQVIQHFRKQVDFVFHCGDSEFTADDPIWEQVDAVVTGNMDFDPQYRRYQVIETAIGNVYIVHGHLHRVGMDNNELFEEAVNNHCQFVFHGHTHALYSEYREGVLIANPGSLHKSRGAYPGRTCMLVTVDDQSIQVDYYDETCQKIENLSKTYDK